MQYRDFEITFLPQQDDRFPVRISSPAGDDHDAFLLPFNQEELSQLIPDLSWSVARGTTRGMRGDVPAPETVAPPEVVGGKLFEALFSGKVRSLFERSLGMLHGQPNVGLRIKLRIDPDEAPELVRVAGLPWEYMYRHNTREFLSLSMHTPVVRYLEVARPPEPLPLKPPLRILFVLASPQDQPALNLQKEKELIDKALGELRKAGDVQFDILEHATAADLLQKLDGQDYHVVHYMGHGSFDTTSGEGMLCLEDREGYTDFLSSRKLMTLLRDRMSVRLVFLNACQTAAMAEEGSVYDAFMGVAPALVMGGVTAVVAMQFPISDEAATAFSEALYTQLARGRPVDEAVSKARQAVQVRTDGQEWGTPVLFMRTADGKIFDVKERIFKEAVEPAPPEVKKRVAEGEAELIPPRPPVLQLGPVALPRKMALGIGGAFLVLIAVLAIVLGIPRPNDGSAVLSPSPSDTSTPTRSPTATVAVAQEPTDTATPLFTFTPVVIVITSTPVDTDTPEPMATETPAPEPTDTPLPTDTPTPLPTDTETPVPTVPLPASIDQPWEEAWKDLREPWKQRLGHSRYQGERLTCVRQQFEGGFMFWCDRQRGRIWPQGWQGPNMIFAVEEAGGNRAWYVEDTWTADQGETPCTYDLPNLKGGFRKVWCENEDVMRALRLPLEYEWEIFKVELTPYGWGPGIQEFEGGYMLWDTHTSRLWVLIEDFGWKSFPIGPGTVTPSPSPTVTPSPTPTPTPAS